MTAEGGEPAAAAAAVREPAAAELAPTEATTTAPEATTTAPAATAPAATAPAATAPAATAPAATEPTAPAATEATTSTPATAEAASSAEGEEGKRRRRRRRGGRRNGEGAAPRGEASAPADDGKEFWETWADEKTTEFQQRSVDDAGTPDDDAPTAPVKADEGGDRGGEEGEESSGGRSARLYVNLGKREEVNADDVRALLGEGLGDDAARIGSVAVRNTHCYVRVPEDLVDRVIEATSGKSYKDREILIERARK